MGYIIKKEYEAGKYNKYAPDSNLISTERLDFIQPTGLKQIVNTVTGDKLDLISDTRVAYDIDSLIDARRETFNVQYGGNDYTVTVDIWNKAFGKEDDYVQSGEYQGTLTQADSGVSKDQIVQLKMGYTGAITEPVMTVKVVGGDLLGREWIAKNFSFACEVRNTYINYGSPQTLENYWNWWSRPVGSNLNGRRTIINKPRYTAHAYSISQSTVYENHVIGTYASWALVSARRDDNANDTLIWDLSLNVGVTNAAGEQGLIAGVYNWDVQFDSVNLVDRVA